MSQPQTQPAAARPRNPQSTCPGVCWDARKGKWQGHISNPLKRTASGGRKYEVTTYFADEAACIVATEALRARVDEQYWEHYTALAEDDPLTADLPCGPEDAADAEEKTLYWRPNYKNDHKPRRVVRANAGKSGAIWLPGCQRAGCVAIALQAAKGGAYEFCQPHGGRCTHGSAWASCRECNPDHVACAKRVHNCSSCAKRIETKRTSTHGGNGLCCDCEAHLRNQAAENGGAPPAKGKRWEDVVLDELVTLVQDAEGRVIQHEMRDDPRSMLGSNKRRNKGACSTDHQRRPDLLYTVRDDNAHIVAVLDVEVDEDSHERRESSCEACKVDETLECMNQLALDQGASRTPFFLFLKFNPNACDAPGGNIKLSTRVKVLARVCNEFLNTPWSEFRARSAEECMTPHVRCLYYHSKKGGKHLAYFDAAAASKAWVWYGNDCPRA